MSEEHTPHTQRPYEEGTPGTQASGSQSQSAPASDLATEMREMGQQIEAAVRALAESERTKQLQRDLMGGARELTSQLQVALKSLQTNPRVQQAEERGRQVISQAKQTKVIQDVQETLVSGLSQFNDQLRKLVDRLESERTGQASGSTTQQVPIDDEHPATGETTKLDE